MTSDGAIDIREIVQAGGARNSFDAMPEEVQENFDRLFSLVQNNKTLRKNDRTELKGRLSGINELRIDFDDDTFRSYFAAEYREVISCWMPALKNRRKTRKSRESRKRR